MRVHQFRFRADERPFGRESCLPARPDGPGPGAQGAATGDGLAGCAVLPSRESMDAMIPDLLGALRDYAARLRFPKLVALTFGLLVIDVLVPDVVPFIDEILLALVTALLASFKRRVKRRPE